MFKFLNSIQYLYNTASSLYPLVLIVPAEICSKHYFQSFYQRNQRLSDDSETFVVDHAGLKITDERHRRATACALFHSHSEQTLRAFRIKIKWGLDVYCTLLMLQAKQCRLRSWMRERVCKNKLRARTNERNKMNYWWLFNCDVVLNETKNDHERFAERFSVSTFNLFASIHSFI